MPNCCKNIEKYSGFLAEVLFKETTDVFTVWVASEPKEIKELLEVWV